MNEKKLKLRLDWSELDYFGHINNVSFFKFIQSARVNFWDITGISQTHKETNIGPMLASCKCDFKLPLFYPGAIEIYTSLSFVKNSSFGFTHKILNEVGEVAAIGKDVMVLYNFNENRKVNISEALRSKLTDRG